MKISFKILSFAVLTVLFLAGCGEKKDMTETMPDDTPWNNGRYAIIETENGYYLNHSHMLFLRYHDKNTGKEVFLCDKPECSHSGGDKCTATYRNIVCTDNYSNIVLYNNEIYFVGADTHDDITDISLYKASADGSSLDKVCRIYETKGIDEKYLTNTELIIHRGYAYISYNFSTDTSLNFSSFVREEFLRVNIRTGEKETIRASDDFFSRPSVSEIKGCGDYVYFVSYSAKNKSEWGDYRYDINSGNIERITEYKEGISDTVKEVTGDVLYVGHYEKADDEDIVYSMWLWDSKTLEKIKQFDIGADRPFENYEMFADFIAYNEKLYVCAGENIHVYGKDGKLISSIVKNKEQDGLKLYFHYHISFDKLYRINSVGVFFCPLSEIEKGNESWEPAYSRDEINSLWYHHYCEIMGYSDDYIYYD